MKELRVKWLLEAYDAKAIEKRAEQPLEFMTVAEILRNYHGE